ncbi:MAG: HDOD domain-containing protein [Candidatus Hydrogenedentes bacterium]|nr:HDOD domain-containing protein [Candidatus Hydrogenedentota bacterium]
MITLKQSTVQRVLNLGDLPTLPDVMARILNVAEDSESNATDLTAILACDPAICTRVLRLANSPFYGARYSVDTIQRAIITIGFEAVKQLALATSVLHAFQSKWNRGFDAEDFWMHSLGAGRAAQLLTRFSGNMTAGDACYTAAVLHDLGKYMLSLSEANAYPALLDEARERARPIRELEEERLHISHDQLGAWMLERWSFPPAIVEGVGYQYMPEHHRGKNHKAICVLALCSDMARQAGLGHGGDECPAIFNPYAMLQLELTEAKMDELLQILSENRADAGAALQMMRE